MMFKTQLIAALIPFAFFAISANANVSSTETQQPAPASTSSTPGQFIDDSTVTLKVKSSFFADDAIKSLSISVSTDKGVVRLSGTVDSEEQKQKAVETAKKVSGVKSVIDELVVKKAS
jgi:hyperosmotically inducible periplasmic protein